MLNKIIAFALRNRLPVLITALALAGYGTYQSIRMPIDVLPDLNRPTVVVLTEAHAMVPEDIERLISYPLEQVLNGATGVTRVRSGSGMGISMIYVEFGWDTDIYLNRQIIQEKLQLARSKLPPGVEPQMAPIASIMGQIQYVGVRSKEGKTHPDELRTIAEYHIKYRLMSLPGVANVVVAGGAPRQLQVMVDADRLNRFNLTLDEVATAIKGSNLNASGGFLEIGPKAPLISVKGFIGKKEDLEAAVVSQDPFRPIRISDIGHVEFGPSAIRTGTAGIDGEPAVILAISKQLDTDTVVLTKRINKELAILADGLPPDLQILNNLFSQADFIHRAVANVAEAIWVGAILVVLVLFLFLLNKRSALITLTAIPLSITTSVLIFNFLGLSINTMTLGGLAVAIGALVDDAIVGVENVNRRLRENLNQGSPKHSLLVIFKASSEVRSPILIGTLLVVAVFIPLFYLTGLEGRLFTPIGITYITTLLASLVVAVMVTPALCYFLLGRSKRLAGIKDSPAVRNLKYLVLVTVTFSLKRPMAILGLLVSLVIGGVFLLVNQGTQFLPEFNEGVAQVNLFLPPETGLKTSDRFGKRLARRLATVEGVEHVARRTGRADGDEHVHGVNFSHCIVTFDPDSNLTRPQIITRIRQLLKEDFPGVMTEVSQPLAHLLSHLLSGVKAQVAIKVFGPNLDVLRRLAKEVEGVIRPIPGVVDLFTEPQVLVDQVSVTPRREALARHGLGVDDLAELVELALEGEHLSLMLVDQFTYPIVIRLAEKDRSSLDSIRNLYLYLQDGRKVLLSQVAKVSLTKTPNNINREHVSRRIAVQHNVSGRSLGEVVSDVEEALIPIRTRLAKMPGYSVRISGQFEAQQEATRMIAVFSVLSLLLMFLLLFFHFKSVNLSLQVLASVPMAFIGAVAYIIISDQNVSVATLVGLISLGGIAARNAILLIDHYIHLLRDEGEFFGPGMIIRAGQERMVPVVMTALTSGIALVPLALAPGEPGRELLYPVATVIIGGLISSTLLDFLVHPVLFWLFGRRAAEKLAAHRDVKELTQKEIEQLINIEKE